MLSQPICACQKDYGCYARPRSIGLRNGRWTKDDGRRMTAVPLKVYIHNSAYAGGAYMAGLEGYKPSKNLSFLH
jgi:hypothetical protein